MISLSKITLKSNFLQPLTKSSSLIFRTKVNRPTAFLRLQIPSKSVGFNGGWRSLKGQAESSKLVGLRKFSNSAACNTGGDNQSNSNLSQQGQATNPLSDQDLNQVSESQQEPHDHQHNHHHYHLPPDFLLHPDFISPDEESRFLKIADEVLGDREYHTEHFDNIIVGYREAFFERFNDEKVQQVVGRMREFALEKILNSNGKEEYQQQSDSRPQQQVKVYYGEINRVGPPKSDAEVDQPLKLNLHPHTQLIDMLSTGKIEPHKDSTLLYGHFTCGLNLNTHAIMRFDRLIDPNRSIKSEGEQRLEDYYKGLKCIWGPELKRPWWETQTEAVQEEEALRNSEKSDFSQSSNTNIQEQVIYVLLPPRCLYLMTGRSRYEWTHAVLNQEETKELLESIPEMNQQLESLDPKFKVRNRRLSVIVRDLGTLDHKAPFWKQILRAYEPDTIKIARRLMKNMRSKEFWRGGIRGIVGVGKWSVGWWKVTKFRG